MFKAGLTCWVVTAFLTEIGNKVNERESAMRIVSTALFLAAFTTALQVSGVSAGPVTPTSAVKNTSPMILSIVPSQAEPGSLVTLALTQLPDDMTLLLGGEEISWKAIDKRRVSFILNAKTKPGQYSLSVRPGNGPTRSYAFTVIPIKPVALSISPDRITSCAGDEVREVTVTGRNFTATSQLLFDGAIIRSRILPPDIIRFTAPSARGGLHQVAIKNGDMTTTALGLSIITAPEISAVTIGNDYVSSYELMIEGDNFQQTSTLLVNGTRIDTAGTLQGERLVYIDCTKIIYQRRPYSSTPKELRLQVVNPDGEASRTVLVSAP